MNARSHALLEPELEVPSEVLATLLRRAPRNDSICRLMTAVLDDALTCLEKNVRARNVREQRRFEEAHQWLMTAGEADEATFSFERVCAALDIDPLYLQAVIRRWRDAQLKAAGSAALRPSKPRRR